MDTAQALDVLHALAQETRLDVVRLLVVHGHEGLKAGDIADQLGVAHNTLSAHLSILLAARLVNRVREGRALWYRIRFDTLSALMAFMLTDCCQGVPEIIDVMPAIVARCQPGDCT
ncbi:MAG: metalloregulator ArsR/SmtB family transcription factor [Pseudomonadota bacterium]